MHRWVRIAIGLLWLAGATAWRGGAQPALHTRVFRTAGGYPLLVSVAPNGTVLTKSGDASALTLLDGYFRRDVLMPEEIIFRVHLSRSAQIWTVTNRGIYLYHNSGWVFYDLPEIRAFLASPARHLRQVAILPAEVNRALVLLPDKLLDFDAGGPQVRVLKEAQATGLGEFTEIQEGLDEAIWISGTLGVARLQGPVRRFPPELTQLPWKEFLLPETNRASNLQRVFESSPGNLTTVANPGTSEKAENRLIAHLQNGKWTEFPVPVEKVRQAWRGWDGEVWGFSTSSLFRVNESDWPAVLRREPLSGPLYDVAVETNGVFWVASGEGLVRYSPFLWRKPAELEEGQTAIHSMVFGPSDEVWLSTPSGLLLRDRNGRRSFPWPEELENQPPRQAIFRLNDGRIVVNGPSHPLVLDPETGRFEPILVPDVLQVHVVGALRNGSVCAWFEHADKALPLDLRTYTGREFVSIPLPESAAVHGDVTFVREASNGDLWVCLGPTLLWVRRAAGTVEHFGPENGLRTERIYALAEVGDGRIWCGTASRIYEFRGQRWEPILNTVDRITGITVGQGTIWVSTLSGIQRFQENSWLVQSSSEGLPPGAVYNVRISPGGEVWAATTRGVFVYHADADAEPPRAFPPILDGLEKPIAGEPTLVRFRGQDRWDYTVASDLLFSYRLDEGSWTPFSNVTARVFQNLSSGNHVIEALAMDRNGNKSRTAGRLEFAVIVPWIRDPRLLSVSALALSLTLVLAGLAVNRHFQLKRSYARVEQMVAERTKELERANQELLHGQKMRALGTMAAGIAHDFNNILSIIKGSAQIIENNVGDPEKIRTRVSRIQTVVDQGTGIVKALLGLGRREEKDLADCDIAQLLHDTRKLLSDRFPESVQFQINAAEDLPLVRCSPDVLQQILLNLILNAVEAMHNEGVVELTASFTHALPPKPVLEPESAGESGPGFVVVAVIDQGGGIAAENLSRIFEPFFTTKAFSTRRGTGLGLSMVYELAKAQGYGLAVETRLGLGSSFSILLPLHPVQPASPGDAPEKAKAAT